MDGEKGGCAAVSAGRGTKTKVRMRLEYQGKYRDISANRPHTTRVAVLRDCMTDMSEILQFGLNPKLWL